MGDGRCQQAGIGEFVPDARLDRGGRGLGSRFRRLAALLLGRLAPAVRFRLVAPLACYPPGPGVRGVVAHRTIWKRRFQRTDVGQRQIAQTCSFSAMEKKIIWARPTMFSNGT